MSWYEAKKEKSKTVAPQNKSGQSFFQPKLTVNQPNDIYEQEADAMADSVMRMPAADKSDTFFKPATAGAKQNNPADIQKEDAKDAPKEEPKETPKAEEKPEAKKGFIDTDSMKKAFDDIILKLPARYREAYENYKKTHETFVFDLSESRKLASDQIMAMWNLSWALVYKASSPYKDLGFGDSVKIAESLSGASDTYVNLASIILHKNLKKYISDEVPDLVIKNLGFILLAGLAIQAGVAGIQYAANNEIDFFSLINPVTSSFTEMPAGLSRPFTLDNIPDPRWKYPFLNPAPGPDLNWSANNPDAKAPAFNFNLGLNFASALSLYPKNEEEKKKYKGLELYPFFNYSHNYTKPGEKEPEKTDKYFAGIFVGDKGVYTLLEGGVITGPLGTMEIYGKGGLTFKNMGALKLGQIDAELDSREKPDAFRARINAAADIEIVDNKEWQFTLGAMAGLLLPSANEPGNVDYGAGLKFFHKTYSADEKDTYKTGVDLSFTNRAQDPFNAASPQLFSLQTKLVFDDVLKIGLQYDKASAQGPSNMFTPLPQGTNLPGSNFTFFTAVDFAPLLFRDEKKKK